jgi:hypothetical protein
MFLIRNMLVGALAGAALGLFVAVLSIAGTIALGFSGHTAVITIVILAVLTAGVGAVLGAILQPVFALVVPGTSSWRIARYAVLGGLVGIIVSAYVAVFVRPRWGSDGGIVGAIVGSSAAVALLRRARRKES